MKKITLIRPRESFNKNCSYEIFIGKRKLIELKNGEEKTIEIPNEYEKNNLKAKIQWCGSKKIKLNLNNENEIFEVTGNKLFNKYLPFIGALFPLTGIIIFSKQNPIFKNIGIGILILLLLYVIGTLTIWSNKWLKIEKKHKNTHYNNGYI